MTTDTPRCGGPCRTYIDWVSNGRFFITVHHHGWRVEVHHRGTRPTAEHHAKVLEHQVAAQCYVEGMADPLGRS